MSLFIQRNGKFKWVLRHTDQRVVVVGVDEPSDSDKVVILLSLGSVDLASHFAQNHISSRAFFDPTLSILEYSHTVLE